MAAATEDVPDESFDECSDDLPVVQKSSKRTIEPGIVYLSKIPQFMSVKKIKQIFEHYGEIGRVFLQPDEKAVGTKKGRIFTEGWVEYQDKRIAKRVALSLNNSPIGGRRHSQWHDQIWNIKYLHRFKWTHLNERLAYEKAVHQQRLRTEIAQVKRETNFHIQNMEKNERLEKKILKEKKKMKNMESNSLNAETELLQKPFEIHQRLTEDEIISKKRKLGETTLQGENDSKSVKQNNKPNLKLQSKKSFLNSIFSGGLAASDD